MAQGTVLWLYFAVVLGVVVLPGLDMAYVLASSLVGGRRAGLAAVAGIAAGGVVHVAVAGTGVAVVVQLWPRAFDALLVAGALYVAWLGISIARSGVALGDVPAGQAPRPLAAVFRQGALTNLLNPKAYVFMLAVFPQFVSPERGPIWLQSAALSLITAATQLAVYGGLALGAAAARSWLAGRPGATVVLGRVVGAFLVLAAAVTGFEGWRGS